MRKVALLAAMVMTAVLGASAPSHAFYKDEIPSIHASSGGPGWTSLKVASDGSEWVIEAYAPVTTGPAQAGISFYTEDGTWAGMFIFTSFPAKQGVYVDANIAGVPNVHVDQMTSGPGGLGLAADFNSPDFPPPFVGVQQVIVWWVGDGKWDFKVKSNGGNTILGLDHGDHAFLHTSKDFTATATAEAYVQGAGAHAQILGDLPIKIDNTLVGIYQQGLLNIGQVSATGPKGDQSCSLAPIAIGPVAGAFCIYSEMTGDGAAGPGTYTFHDTSIGVGFNGSFDDVWVGGADARLPATDGR